jgi:hypothetical protein
VISPDASALFLTRQSCLRNHIDGDAPLKRGHELPSYDATYLVLTHRLAAMLDSSDRRSISTKDLGVGLDASSCA